MSRGRSWRTFSLASLLGLVGVLALGLAAMRDASTLAACLVLCATLALLFLGALGAVVRPAPAAAWWGFALFGWGFFLLNLLTAENALFTPAVLPTEVVVAYVVDRVHPPTVEPRLPPAVEPHSPVPAGISIIPGPDGKSLDFIRRGNIVAHRTLTEAELPSWIAYRKDMDAHRARSKVLAEKVPNAKRIGRAMVTLALAVAGAIAGEAIAARPRSVAAAPDSAPERIEP